jgi:hypothetical protein
MTPSALVLSAGRERLTATDQTNRVLVARRLNALDKLRLLKAAGPALSENQAWLGVAMLAASVVEIDGVPVPLPTTEQQIEGLVGKLGDDGLDSIAALLARPENPDPDMAGNLPGTPT